MNSRTPTADHTKPRRAAGATATPGVNMGAGGGPLSSFGALRSSDTRSLLSDLVVCVTGDENSCCAPPAGPPVSIAGARVAISIDKPITVRPDVPHPFLGSRMQPAEETI